MPDHLHILDGLCPDMALADLMRDIEANSSRFISEQGWVVGKFSWQRGYGAFSYSASHLERVGRYIHSQQMYHATKSFREEYQGPLDAFGVQYDVYYLLDEVEYPVGYYVPPLCGLVYLIMLKATTISPLRGWHCKLLLGSN